MKMIKPLLLVLLLGCDDQGPQSSGRIIYSLKITSNYTAPVDESVQWYEPVDFDNHECDTLPTIYYNDLPPDRPIKIKMFFYSFCSNELELRI